ncbi:MAG: DUF58 domain-containing protein [Acidimicrobiales bacterium]
MSALLSAGLMARLERLQLVNRRRLLGGLAGEHRSPKHGSSLDFADFREYYPGDDLRRLDIGALARLDRLLIKLYDAEDDLTLRILIDASASMAGAKLARARELAAAFGFTALTRRDVVTVHTFPYERRGPRFRGRTATGPLFDHLESIEAGGNTPFTAAVDRVLAQPGPPGLTVVLSDLLTGEWEAGVRRLPARRGELSVVHVLDPTDLAPDMSGDLELVDTETGARVDVSLSTTVLADYRELADRWVADVAARVAATGGSYLRVFTTDDLERVLLGWAREAGTLR